MEMIKLPSKPMTGYNLIQWKIQWLMFIIIMVFYNAFNWMFPWVIPARARRAAQEAAERAEQRMYEEYDGSECPSCCYQDDDGYWVHCCCCPHSEAFDSDDHEYWDYVNSCCWHCGFGLG